MKIFIVEDEKILRISLIDELQDAGYEVVGFENPNEALEKIQSQEVDVVLTDIKMPGMDGMELLEKIKQKNEQITVIMMTAFGSVDSAVEAMKKGAYDYLTKPFHTDELLLILNRLKEIKSIKNENRQFKQEISQKYSIEAFVGVSQAAKKTKDMIKIVAESDASVLITGETGTGKELVANIIHYNSARKDKILVKVSCAILARDVFESELFGHEKGAFTGAFKERIGRFEQANGGTIYLDDVDDIPLELQVKLLRVLQEKEMERVGGNKTIKINTRVIASTKADLRKLAQEGKFREDLYYRLNVFPIHLLPLRERREDIPLLIDYFLKQIAPNKNYYVSPQTLEYLKNYTWPGNVRELKNVVERLVLLSKENEIKVDLLPAEILQNDCFGSELSLGQLPLDQILMNVERKLIWDALEQANGNQTRAAQILQIPPSTLRSKMKKYNLTGK
jgi:DNA-binding NtrC family response regulator